MTISSACFIKLINFQVVISLRNSYSEQNIFRYEEKFSELVMVHKI